MQTESRLPSGICSDSASGLSCGFGAILECLEIRGRGAAAAGRKSVICSWSSKTTSSFFPIKIAAFQTQAICSGTGRGGSAVGSGRRLSQRRGQNVGFGNTPTDSFSIRLAHDRFQSPSLIPHMQLSIEWLSRMEEHSAAVKSLVAAEA